VYSNPLTDLHGFFTGGQAEFARDTYMDNQLMFGTAELSKLEELVGEAAALARSRRNAILGQSADVSLGPLRVAQVVGGLRGVTCIICETSTVEPKAGLMIRGKPLSQLAGCTPEAVFLLLLTGEMPDTGSLAALSAAISGRPVLPPYVEDVIRAFPQGSHPMALLSAGLMSMQRESEFARSYGTVPTADLWRPALSDAVRLFSLLPAIASVVYRVTVNSDVRYSPAPELDWAGRLAAGLNTAPAVEQAGFADMLRLLAVVQSDHEGANACALAANAVGSALASPFLAVSAGLDALAGPIHGLASEVSFRFIQGIIKEHGQDIGADELRAICSERLDKGFVIPGFGHAVLRSHDPRFTLVHDAAQAHMSDDPVFRVCHLMAEIVPEMLAERGKAKNPWPNIDFISGPVLHHYGLEDPRFFTVVFGISLAIGVVAQYVVNRALGMPIMRPRSISLAGLRQVCDDGGTT
jgi:citrate synthase